MTYTAFVAMLAALPVAGIVKRYPSAPSQLNTAQLPASWPRLPSGNTPVAALTGGVGLQEFTCDLCIAIEPMQQGTPQQNLARGVALLDSLQAAFVAEAERGIIDSWTVRLDGELLGDTPFWVIVATVTGSE